jgi:DNA-binding transcriptional LysR family regulator
MAKKLGLSRVSDIDLRLLRIFKVIVEAGGFAAAEVELNISRAAISMAMGDLETRIGLRLCQRGRAGFSVSEAGQEVYQAILQLLASIEGFRTQVNALHDQLQGELNIGIADNLVTLPHMRITNALRQLKQQGTGVTINISMMAPHNIEKAVLDGRLQVGVIPEVRRLPELDFQPLYEEESRLYCSFQHPLFNHAEKHQTIEQVPEYDAVAPAYAQTADTRQHYQQLKTSSTATDREGVAFLILTGCYIGYLPTHYATQWIQQDKLRAIAPGHFHFTTSYGVVTRRSKRTNPVLEGWLNALWQDN